MPSIRHLESSPWAVYNGGSQCKGFVSGEVRQLPEDVAEYLLSTFPGCFERVGGKTTESAAVAAPEKHAAAKPPAKRKAATKRKAPAKKGKA